MTSLAEHNLLYREPWLYDALYADDTGRAELLLQLITAYGPPATGTLLDLGCGTGRDLADLATQAPWLATTGVDLQPGMIDHGHRTHPQLDLRVGDLRMVRLGRSVDVITCLGNTLAYLHTDTDLDNAFTTIAAHAHSATLLVIQTLIGTPNTNPPRTTIITLGEVAATVTTSTTWDPTTGIATTNRQWVFEDGRQATDHLRRRAIPADELRDRLTCAGLTLCVLADDPTDPTGTATSPITYAVATPAAR